MEEFADTVEHIISRLLVEHIIIGIEIPNTESLMECGNRRNHGIRIETWSVLLKQ
jgi:hypothetical protein